MRVSNRVGVAIIVGGRYYATEDEISLRSDEDAVDGPLPLARIRAPGPDEIRACASEIISAAEDAELVLVRREVLEVLRATAAVGRILRALRVAGTPDLRGSTWYRDEKTDRVMEVRVDRILVTDEWDG